VLLAGDAGEDEEGVVLAIADFCREADRSEPFDQLFEAGLRSAFIWNVL